MTKFAGFESANLQRGDHVARPTQPIPDPDFEPERSLEIVNKFLSPSNTQTAEAAALQIDAVIPDSHRNCRGPGERYSVSSFLRGFWPDFIEIVTKTPAESMQHAQLVDLTLALADLPMTENAVSLPVFSERGAFSLGIY
jgi:hypothetical protein